MVLGTEHHSLRAFQCVWAEIDTEPDGQPSPFAVGDGNPDEDGVFKVQSMFIGVGNPIEVVASRSGFLNAWVDFNQNGAWDGGEEVLSAEPLNAGNNKLAIPVPAGTNPGITYSRFRVSTLQGAGVDPTGEAPDGEVEDYAVRLCPLPQPPDCCADVMLVLDTSGSMRGTRIAEMVRGAKDFVSLARPSFHMGLVVFTNTHQLVQPLTADHAAVITALDGLTASPSFSTRMAAAIDAAQAELADNGRPECPNVMIIFSDGEVGDTTAASASAATARSQGTRIIVIGIQVTPGSQFETFLQGLVGDPADYHNAPHPSVMQVIMRDLVWEVCEKPPPDPPCLPPGGAGGGNADFGDAPDSTNHFFGKIMMAYPSIQALFPTVYDLATGQPPGPRHLAPDADIRLGPEASVESDADWPPDEDIVTNINPPRDRADRDWYDDGVHFPISLPDCVQTSFTYTVTVVLGPNTRYVNAWLDFNRDGDWADTLTCNDPQRGVVTVYEWAVRDQALFLSPGTHAVQTPLFDSHHPAGLSGSALWMRINVAEQTAPAPQDGRGPLAGYSVGETEDYWLTVGQGGGNSYKPHEE